jgi:hypothetical protein
MAEKSTCEFQCAQYILEYMKYLHVRLGIVPAVLLAGILVFTGGCSSDSTPEIEVAEVSDRHLGLWESVKVSATGMGDAIELEANGSTRRFRLNVNNARYKVLGDSLIFYALVPEGIEVDSADIPRAAMKFTVTRDTLVRHVPPHTYWLERLPSERDPDNLLVGTWRVRRSTHNLTVHKFERYSADGLIYERTPGVMDQGFYGISADTLFLNYDDRPKKEIHYEINGDTLAIARFRVPVDSLSDSLRPYYFSRYVRVGDRAWYYRGEQP